MAIDIKDGYAVIAAGGDFEPEFIKIDFKESDFVDNSEQNNSDMPGLFDLGGEHAIELYNKADEIALAVPMRFSLVKPVSICQTAIKAYGDEFLNWEASQILPEELGHFTHNFSKLAQSYDNKFIKYMYYAVPSDFIEVLKDFAVPDSAKRITLSSEAIGLINMINHISNNHGFNAAISLEHDGASIVMSNNGDFLSGRFINADKSNLFDEIAFYIMGYAPDGVTPRALICGDLSQLAGISNISWAEMLKMPESFDNIKKTDLVLTEVFAAVAGLTME